MQPLNHPLNAYFLIFTIDIQDLATPSTYDTRQLLLLLAAGDEQAYKSLYDQYRNRIYSLAFQLIKSKPVAEDVLQEVFVSIWLNRHLLPDLENFHAWLRTITRNNLYNRLRKLATEEAFIRSVIDEKKPEGEEDTMATVAGNELKQLLHQAIAQLTPQQRKVYLMGKEEGLRYDQIAAELKLSRDTVKYHMTEALRSIRQYLQQHEHRLIFFILLLGEKILK
ncbi:MAG: RNA polymerase sigma-70 factor [Chitinophagaceae bacterium]|nr:RNA polymerase sigma-70 factor [Chitinophagaceae bacterium]